MGGSIPYHTGHCSPYRSKDGSGRGKASFDCALAVPARTDRARDGRPRSALCVLHRLCIVPVSCRPFRFSTVVAGLIYARPSLLRDAEPGSASQSPHVCFSLCLPAVAFPFRFCRVACLLARQRFGNRKTGTGGDVNWPSTVVDVGVTRGFLITGTRHMHLCDPAIPAVISRRQRY